MSSPIKYNVSEGEIPTIWERNGEAEIRCPICGDPVVVSAQDGGGCSTCGKEFYLRWSVAAYGLDPDELLIEVELED